MKTPEEIKKALRRCAQGGDIEDCMKFCPFYGGCAGGMKDAAAYIEQLEEQIILMKIQMHGDCGCCKHRLDERKVEDGQLGCRLSPACYECLKKDGRSMWEYEGLPE